ncbi:hypothetical protein TNCV_2104561 [Trichonephila clavipes]|nr:hypothetical protein TNCV_2104561 [Trichonephila clavipes]
MPSRHGCTLNSRRATSPLMLVEGEERWEVPDYLPGCSPSKLGWNREQNRTVTCIVLKDEFRVPLSDVTADQVT